MTPSTSPKPTGAPARHAAGAALAAAVLAVLAACAPPRALEAIEVLRDIAGTTAPGAPAGAGSAPGRVAVRYAGSGARRAGDLYALPNGRAGLVLVPGAAETGKDDPRLRAFARALARAGFTVLVPEIPSLRRLMVRPEDAVDVADAVAFLSRRGAGDDPAAVGIAAISYAAGPAVLAALDPRVRDRVGFVIAVGGYYDIDAVVTYFTTGYYRASGGEWRHRRPNVYGKWVFVRGNLERIRDASDRRLLAAISDRKLRDPASETAGLEANLGEEGRAVMALLRNRDPESVPRLIARLPPDIRRDMAGLDLDGRELSRLRANLILIHGRDDAIIPFTESAALAGAAPPGRAALYLVDNLAHVDLRPGGIGDTFTLWRAVYRLLAERDRIAERD